MRLIAHRGLFTVRVLSSKDHFGENHPQQIDAAIAKGYDAEIDLWVIKETDLDKINNCHLKQAGYYLGHDKPEYLIDVNWLDQRKDSLWIHCKNLEAMHIPFGLNHFWHQNDDYTLTSKGYIWTYPRIELTLSPKSVIVTPEIMFSTREVQKLIRSDVAYGVCTKYIEV